MLLVVLCVVSAVTGPASGYCGVGAPRRAVNGGGWRGQTGKDGDRTEHGPAIDEEHERRDDLPHVHADGGGGVLRRAGAFGELMHLDLETEGAGGVGDSLGGG